MRLILIYLCCALPLLADQVWYVPLDESGKSGELEIVLVTSLGSAAVNTASIMVESLQQGKPGPKRWGYRSMTLPYGTYRVHVGYPGAYSAEKIVRVKDRFQVVTICLYIDPVRSPGMESGSLVRGQLPPTSVKRGCSLVRLICPYCDGSAVETKASPTGYFALEHVRPGKYIAFTMGADGACDTTSLEILYSTPTIDLVFQK